MWLFSIAFILTIGYNVTIASNRKDEAMSNITGIYADTFFIKDGAADLYGVDPQQVLAEVSNNDIIDYVKENCLTELLDSVKEDEAEQKLINEASRG